MLYVNAIPEYVEDLVLEWLMVLEGGVLLGLIWPGGGGMDPKYNLGLVSEVRNEAPYTRVWTWVIGQTGLEKLCIPIVF